MNSLYLLLFCNELFYMSMAEKHALYITSLQTILLSPLYILLVYLNGNNTAKGENNIKYAS